MAPSLQSRMGCILPRHYGMQDGRVVSRLLVLSPMARVTLRVRIRGVRVYPYPRVYPTRPVPVGTGLVGEMSHGLGRVG